MELFALNFDLLKVFFIWFLNIEMYAKIKLLETVRSSKMDENGIV